MIDFEQKLKMASQYFISSVLLVAGILFTIFGIVELLYRYSILEHTYINLIVGIYLIGGAIFGLKISRLKIGKIEYQKKAHR